MLVILLVLKGARLKLVSEDKGEISVTWLLFTERRVKFISDARRKIGDLIVSQFQLTRFFKEARGERSRI